MTTNTRPINRNPKNVNINSKVLAVLFLVIAGLGIIVDFIGLQVIYDYNSFWQSGLIGCAALSLIFGFYKHSEKYKIFFPMSTAVVGVIFYAIQTLEHVSYLIEHKYSFNYSLLYIIFYSLSSGVWICGIVIIYTVFEFCNKNN